MFHVDGDGVPTSTPDQWQRDKHGELEARRPAGETHRLHDEDLQDRLISFSRSIHLRCMTLRLVSKAPV